jgi:hypothetical protein
VSVKPRRQLRGQASLQQGLRPAIPTLHDPETPMASVEAIGSSLKQASAHPIELLVYLL